VSKTDPTQSKIVCTLGPASHSREQIKILAETGMDVARINFSHGTPEYKESLFNTIREVEPNLAILCDIQGPKIRIGQVIDGGKILIAGDYIEVCQEEVLGDQKKINISYDGLVKEAKIGELIFINDGTVCIEVVEKRSDSLHCKIVTGGFISSRKGVNLPSTKISLRVPTEKDREDLKLISRLNPEYIALSFVCDADDIKNVRELLKEHGNETIKIISKIERPVALKNFDEILKASDAIMVARGDLGVELPPEEVIPAQKMMIRRCNIHGKPIIVATQMLESMIKAPVPTRAEVSDIHNAIEDGSDAVMLSAETASGDFPVKAVAIMERIIRMSESMIPERNPLAFASNSKNIAEIIGHLVHTACRELKKKNCEGGKIICLTQSGYTARMISKYRPKLPIIAITPFKNVARDLRLVWGVEAIILEGMNEMDEALELTKSSIQACLDAGKISESEKLIITGNFFDSPELTNMLSILKASDVL
jgi:pyruvate kinase